MKELNKFYFFEFLEAKDKAKLESICIKKSFNKGEILFYKGDEARYLHFLIKGQVKLYTHDYKENEVIIHNLKATTLIAEAACFEEVNFPANCICEENCEVLLFEYEEFRNELLLKPQIALFFIKSLSKKIKSLQSFISYNVSSSTTQRIVKFLYENEDLLFDLRQAKIAKILNITPETLSRKISKLKQENIIQNEKGFIKIINHKKLKELISE